MEVVCDELFGQLHNYTSSYVIDRVQAEEIVQETFVYLWEHRHALRPDSSLRQMSSGKSTKKCFLLVHIQRFKSRTPDGDFPGISFRIISPMWLTLRGYGSP